MTSIMIAGRTGSAITAEIGSMNMREEIDALKVMALDPLEVLVIPRLIALAIALPMLTFLADIADAWRRPHRQLDLRRDDARCVYRAPPAGHRDRDLLVGLIKAPFMAVVIGLIASTEGMEVRGSAESLGRCVTSSVVKSIFMVIVMDGLFAMFFAAVDY